MNQPNISNIYKKFCSGESLSDAEVIIGEKHFQTLADLLYRSGMAFEITAKESNRVYLGLRSYREHRNLEQSK